MDNSMSLIPRLINEGLVLNKYRERDLEFLVEEAIKSHYYYSDEIPDFYEIWDNFMDLILSYSRYEFFLDGVETWRNEISEATLALILNMNKVEFQDFGGTIHNQCQNIVMKEMM